MSIFYTDTDTLEMGRDRIRAILTHIEEAYGTMRQMYNQMLTEIGFDGYPQWASALNESEKVMHEIEILCQRMENVKSLMERMPDEYIQLEKVYINQINQMNVIMNDLQSGFETLMSSVYPLGLREGLELSDAGRLERETGNAVAGMELANIMAVTKVLEEEYQYEKVEPVNVMTYIEGTKNSGKDDEE